MTAIIIFCILSSLLVLGKILRTAVPLLQKLYLPSSVIGGILGLILFSFFDDKTAHRQSILELKQQNSLLPLQLIWVQLQLIIPFYPPWMRSIQFFLFMNWISKMHRHPSYH